MSEPIKVGDVVVVVRPRRCGCTSGLGLIWRIERFTTDGRPGQCPECHQLTFQANTPTVLAPNNGHTEVSRLKRIPPLSELEGEKQKEDLREPA